MTSSHIKRLSTSVVAIPLLVALVLEGGVNGFAVLIGAVGSVSLLEYYGLFFPKKRIDVRVVGIALGVIAFWWFYRQDLEKLWALLVFTFFVAAFFCLREGKASGTPKQNAAVFQIVGFVYIPVFLGHIIWVRQWENGIGWVFFLLVVVFSGDTVAYYVGKRFGRHKLAPKISPGKTVEGSVGGLLGSVVGGVLFEFFWSMDCSMGVAAGLAVPTAAFAQLGDLFESVLKRSVGRKDSGAILPGHGGILDRIDGLLFATPLLCYLKQFWLGG